MNQEQCTTCYQIACKKCDWVATEEDVLLIQKGEVTKCPICGWKPGDKI